MRIVHAVYSLEVGGAEVLVSQLCRLQREQGHEVLLFCYSRLGPIGETLQAEGFDIYVPGDAPAWQTMLRYFRRLRLVRPDVLHCHNVAPTLQGVIPARLTGVRRVLCTLHGLRILPDTWTARTRFQLVGWLCNWVTGVCETTCVNLRRGILAPRDKIVRIYNGATPVVRTSFDHLEKRGFTLVFIGRLAPEKDLATLIRAMADARQEVPELDLWLVGEGRSRPQLEALIAELGIGDRVKLWGQRTDTRAFFSAADLFVMSSISEGLPMSLLESMSLGIPAILTDVGGMGEALRLTGGGVLVPVGDAGAMARAIVRLARDPDLRLELSAKAERAYHQDFALARMAEGYMGLYQQ